MLKRILFSIAFILITNIIFAYDFSVNEIYYKIVDENGVKTVKVVSNPNHYSGAVVIPSSVNYNGTSYSVTSIGTSAFTYCDGLTSITIPNSVVNIEFAAFQYCRGSFSLNIPNSVKTIGDEAFYGCSGITSITLGNSIETIGFSAFSECSSITSIVIPSSVKSFDDSAFMNCANLTSIKVESGNKKYDSRNNCNAIIQTENDELITGCMNTVIPDDINFIGYGAFYGCTGLTSINLPSSVFYVGKYAFYGCSSLTTLYIPRRLTSIDEKAFSGCSGLCSIIVDSENYQYDSRNNCNAIIDTETNALLVGCQNTTIPDDVTKISKYAFENCINLQSLVIPNTVTSIEREAFQGCSGLTSINLPNGLKSISSSLFEGCVSLCSISIPNSVTTINASAFSGCIALSSITIPSSVTKIGLRVLEGCNGLNSIIVDSQNTVFDSHDNCNAIVEINTNTLISGCKKTIIPSDIQYIGDYAFRGITSLTSVVVPSNIIGIGTYSFRGCDGLTSVTVDITDPLTIGDYTFTNRANATLYVPKGCVSNYEAAEFWNEFKEIHEIDLGDDYVLGDANGDGKVTVADYTAIAHYIMGNAPTNFNEKAADANGDGKINVADYTAAAHLLLYGTVEKPNNAKSNIVELEKE